MAKKKRKTSEDERYEAEIADIARRFKKLGIEDRGVESALIEIRKHLALVESGLQDVLNEIGELKKPGREPQPTRASAGNAPKQKKTKKRRKSS